MSRDGAEANEGDDAPSAYLRATTTRSLPGVYFIGPYGHRVSFASQQRRALNTVWALFALGQMKPDQPGLIRPRSRVAVIGAGLAGITTATALMAKKCLVSLYEKESGPLQTQALASHRLVHPSLNFWPEEPMAPDTAFPFYDWASERCSQVIENLREEWEGVEAKRGLKAKPGFAKNLQKFYRNCDVRSLEPLAGGRVRVIPRAMPTADQTYDAVFVTCGFGAEEKVGLTTGSGYWDPDRLEEISAGPFSSYLVSGTGDGGLIDALRIVHMRFDHGELAIEIASDLSRLGLDSTLARIEAAANMTGDTAAAANIYHREYQAFLRDDMPEALRRTLDHSLVRIPDRTVKLIGQLPHPYSVGAAPIHKLLIAHSIEEKVLSYERADLKPGHDQLFLHPPGASPRPVAPDLAIARHGSDRPLNRFIPDEGERHDLRQRQSVFSDLLQLRPLPRGFFDQEGFPPFDPASILFVRQRAPRAESYLRRRFGVRSNVAWRGGEAIYHVTPADDEMIDPSLLPRQMFGVRLEVGVIRKTGRNLVGRPPHG